MIWILRTDLSTGAKELIGYVDDHLARRYMAYWWFLSNANHSLYLNAHKIKAFLKNEWFTEEGFYQDCKLILRYSEWLKGMDAYADKQHIFELKRRVEVADLIVPGHFYTKQFDDKSALYFEFESFQKSGEIPEIYTRRIPGYDFNLNQQLKRESPY